MNARGASMRQIKARPRRWLGLALLVLNVIGCGDRDQPDAAALRRAADADSATRYASDPDQAVRQTLANIRPAAVKEPRPTGPLAPGATCITSGCHTEFVTARHVHGPVSVASCDACHGDDVGGHVYPLKRQGNATCTFCHAVADSPGKVQHAAITDEGCTSCHNPHASTAKYLLVKDAVSQTCGQCHDTPRGTYEHAPFAAGQCNLCHAPHESDHAMLLRHGSGPAHCMTCHADLGARIADAAFVHEPAKTDCAACHGAHASEFPRQLKDAQAQTCFACHTEMAEHVKTAAVSHDAVFTEASCANCHDPHASGRDDLLRKRADELCLSCHFKKVRTDEGRTVAAMGAVLGRKFLHGPVKAGDCTACHNAHGSSQTRLLRETFPETFYASFELSNYALCFRCHDKALVLEEKTPALTEFRDGERNLHFVHVNRDQKGRTCKTCHAIHGSDLPNHMASDVPFEGSNWAMPIKFQKMPTGGSCAPGCHEPMTYSREGVDAETR